ncbi:hypothetical protein K438DRAFT_1808273 [Mycena galopus ATCC 62051]|nr:hypothetical protein K438DRAFT_1808273 [Mycena galopus ATCC 62051]
MNSMAASLVTGAACQRSVFFQWSGRSQSYILSQKRVGYFVIGPENLIGASGSGQTDGTDGLTAPDYRYGPTGDTKGERKARDANRWGSHKRQRSVSCRSSSHTKTTTAREEMGAGGASAVERGQQTRIRVEDSSIWIGARVLQGTVWREGKCKWKAIRTWCRLGCASRRSCTSLATKPLRVGSSNGRAPAPAARASCDLGVGRGVYRSRCHPTSADLSLLPLLLISPTPHWRTSSAVDIKGAREVDTQQGDERQEASRRKSGGP